MKKLLILFATALSLSVIFAAGWASGKNVNTANLPEPAAIHSEEPADISHDKGVKDLGTDDDFNGDHRHKMPRFRFKNLVLPGIPRP